MTPEEIWGKLELAGWYFHKDQCSGKGSESLLFVNVILKVIQHVMLPKVSMVILIW